MRCSLCSHASRAAIEAAAARTSIADAAEKYGVSERALERHIASHTRAPVKKAASPTRARTSQARVRATSPRTSSAAHDDDDSPATSRSPASAPTARANAHRIGKAIDTLLDRARKDSDASYQDISSLARAALSANRQLAQLTGEWGASESTVASSPHFKRLLNVILEALRGPQFAAPRTAVIDALEREESGANRAAVAA